MISPDSSEFRGGRQRPPAPPAAFIILGALLTAYGVAARSTTFGVVVLAIGAVVLLFGIIAAAVRLGVQSGDHGAADDKHDAT